MGEKAILIGLFFITHTAYNEYFSKFQTFIVPSSPPVPSKQYLGDAAAEHSSSWQSRISRTMMN